MIENVFMSSRDEKQHGFHTLTSTQTQFQLIFELSVMRSAASVMCDVHVMCTFTVSNQSLLLNVFRMFILFFFVIFSL